jgi:hypothetical protein
MRNTVIVRETGPKDDSQLLAAQSKVDIFVHMIKQELTNHMINSDFYFSLATKRTSEQCNEFLITMRTQRGQK